MTELNPRQRYTAMFLTAVMVIGMIAMGAFVAMPTAADEESTPGADIPEYESPDAEDFDLFVDETGGDQTAGYDDDIPEFDNLQDAINETDEDNESILVFNGSYDGVNYDDAEFAEDNDSYLATYYGPDHTSIDGEFNVTDNHPDSVTLEGFNVTAGEEESAIWIDNDETDLELVHNEIYGDGSPVVDHAGDIEVTDTHLEGAEADHGIDADGVTIDNSIVNDTTTGVNTSSAASLTNVNLTEVETGLDATGLDEDVSVDLSHINSSETGVDISTSANVDVTNSNFIGDDTEATAIELGDDNPEFVTVEGVTATDVGDEGTVVDLNSWEETASISGVQADNGEAVNVNADDDDAGLELEVSGITGDGDVVIDADVRYTSITASDLDANVHVDGIEDDSQTELAIDAVTTEDGSINVTLPDDQRINAVDLSNIAVNGTDAGVDIDGDESTVRNSFTLYNVSATGEDNAGISIDNVITSSGLDDGIELTDLNVEDAYDAGITLNDSVDAHTVSISEVHVTGAETGIAYNASEDATADVSLYDVNASDNTYGIVFSDDAATGELNIHNSEISENDYGVDLGDGSLSGYVNVTESDLSDNDGAAIDATGDFGADELVVYDNTFEDNAPSIDFDTDATDLSVSENDFEGDGADAIDISDAPEEVLIADNNFLDTEGTALDISDAGAAFDVEEDEYVINENFWGDDSGPAITNDSYADVFYALGAELVVDEDAQFDDPEYITPWLDEDGNEVIAFYGTVEDPEGDAHDGAEVSFDFMHYGSGDEGDYTFDETSDSGEFVAVVEQTGGHTANASSPGHATSDNVDFTIASANYLEGGVTFELNEGGFLEADVVGPDNVSPSEGEVFDLYDAEDDTTLATGVEVDEDGAINASVSPGEYDVYLAHEDYDEGLFPNSSVHSYDLTEAGETVEGDDFEMGGQLNMTVYDDDGDLFDNGTVDLIEAEDELLADWSGDIELDENGTHTINLTADDHTAMVSNESYSPSDAVDFTIEGGVDEMTNATFELNELDHATLIATIEDADGDPLDEGTEITFEAGPNAPHDGGDLPVTEEVDENSQVEITIPADYDYSPYTITATGPNDTFSTKGVAPGPGETVERTFTLDDPTPADIEITDIETDPVDVISGQVVDFHVTLENTGEAPGVTNVTVEVLDTDLEFTEEGVQVPGEDSIEITISEQIDLDPGIYDYTVSEDHSDTSMSDQFVVAEAPVAEADFQFTEMSAPNNVDEGQEFDVSVALENEGNAEGTQDIVLTANGEELASEEVTLDAGGATAVDFEGVSIADAGDYTLEITSDDDSISQPITVHEEDVDTPTPTPDEDDVPGFGIAIALMALFGAALLAYRRYQG